MTDFLSNQFQECSWKGISFPIELVSEKGSQRLAIHHKMDRDGAQVENTGRGPYSFSIKAFFLDSLTPGINETWKDLFPGTWLRLKSILEQRDTGIFNHPLYGNINCKVVSWSSNFSAAVRNGCVVDIDFIETIDDSNELVQASQVSAALTAAKNLDLAKIGFPGKGFFQQISEIVTDVSQFVNKIKSVISEVEIFLKVLDKRLSPDPILYDNAYALLDNLNTMFLLANAKSKETSIYTVGFPSTLDAIAGYVGNSVEDIIALNPNLVSSAIIPSGTKVAYYSV